MPQVVTEKLPKVQASVAAALEDGVTLPKLNLGPFLAKVDGAKEQLAADIRRIQETLGFYSIVNHGIPRALIDAAEEQSRLAFMLPEEEKQRSLKEGHMQGYWPPNSVSNTRPGYEGERKKRSTLSGWAFLRDREDDDPKVLQNLRHRSQNKWPNPELLPDFRPTMNRYHQAMVELGLKLVQVYALALGLPEDYFDQDFVDAEWYSRCNYYSPQEAADEMVMGTTAHSDHSFLTLLPISSVPGLQVRTPDDTWIDVAFEPDAIIVNTGEWLNHRTNGRFLATPHRVLQPTSERISMPVFIDPNDDSVNEPVPGTIAAGETRKFPPMRWHEFFVNYIDGYSKA